MVKWRDNDVTVGVYADRFLPLFHNFTTKRRKKLASEHQAIGLFSSCGSDEGDSEEIQARRIGPWKLRKREREKKRKWKRNRK